MCARETLVSLLTQVQTHRLLCRLGVRSKKHPMLCNHDYAEISTMNALLKSFPAQNVSKLELLGQLKILFNYN